METYAFYSFITATVAYSITLLACIRKISLNWVNLSFGLALVASIIWAASVSYVEMNEELFINQTLPLESLRNIAWYFFITVLIIERQYHQKISLLFKYWQSYLVILFFIVSIILESSEFARTLGQQFLKQDIRLYIPVLYSIFGLILIEQLYRNASLEEHWSIKFLCLALGAIFIADFLVYSKSMMFSKLDFSLWSSRGFINAMFTPLLYISFQRLQNNSTEISLSRKLVFHTLMLFGSGMYLIIMSIAGFYLRLYGGEWGEIAQIIFIFLSIVLLLLLFISGKTRASAKVFINKHFFHYNYDYREEWIKLSKTLATLNDLNKLSTFIIKTLAKLVDSTGGEIYLKNEDGDFYRAESHNSRFKVAHLLKKTDPTINFMNQKKWIIDLDQLLNDPKKYSDPALYQCLSKTRNLWLIIPLFQQQEMVAIVALNKSQSSRFLNWEDHDILETVGMQLANALMLCHTSDQLARSRQFETYNRLSAYLVHDLKNLVAQISLIVKNAEKHKHNPEFIEDSILTLQNVVTKMQHLVTQLKHGKIETNSTIVDLTVIAKDIALQQSSKKPIIDIRFDVLECPVYADRNKLTSILGHLIQNAQEATSNQGYVRLNISTQNDQAIVTLTDNGIGMDNKFISERLFKPFDTTKGNAGMGIGVYEAREYIMKLSGQINVNSTPGQGTEFKILIPLVKHNA